MESNATKHSSTHSEQKYEKGVKPVIAPNQIPVRLIATTPKGDIPLSAESHARRLPGGPQGTDTELDLRYGPYLEAVGYLLRRNNYQKILEALACRLDRIVQLEEIDFIEIRTEKHGASYHVARADLSVSGNILSFATNVATSDADRSELERDFRLLAKLGRRYLYQFLPQVYYKGAGRYREIGKASRWLHMYVAEWLKGYYEFHLRLEQKDSSYRMLLWDLDRGSRYLSQDQCLDLYRQATKVLTLYYDLNNSRQIYPWHHAAGDFVLKEDGGRVDVRLITIRDYGPVVDFRTGKREGKLLALILFFLHLTIQMRLDRLDGVGDVVWVDDYCLEGVVAGFFEGLTQRDVRSRRGMPSVPEIQDLLRRFTKDEWMQVLVEVLGTYKFSQEEFSHIRDQGEAHIEHLQKVLATLD
jgi:hypothetical protein